MSPPTSTPITPAPLTAVPESAALTSHRSVLRGVLTLAVPTTLLASVQVVAQLVETWLAARQGTAALAGWAVLLPFAMLMQQMSTGAMGGGVVSALARALGAKRNADAAALVLHAVWIALGFGLVFALGMGLFAHPLIHAIAGPEAAAAAAPYAVWLFAVGAIPTWLSNTFASVLRGGGRHALAARVLLGQAVAYPGLAWVLAVPGNLGLTGVGISFACVSWVSAAVMAMVVLRGGAGFVPSRGVAPSGELFRRILSVGAVACVLALVGNLTTIVVTAQMREHGPSVVAAYGIAARLEFLVIPLVFGVGAALTTLVGRAVGAGDWARARRTAWVGGSVAFLSTGALGLSVAMFPVGFASLFTPDPAVAQTAARALTYTGLAFGGFGLGMAMYFASQGAARMGGPIVATLTRFAIAVGGGWWLSHHTAMGLDGQFAAVALGIAVYGLLMAASVRRGVWSAR